MTMPELFTVARLALYCVHLANCVHVFLKGTSRPDKPSSDLSTNYVISDVSVCLSKIERMPVLSTATGCCTVFINFIGALFLACELLYLRKDLSYPRRFQCQGDLIANFMHRKAE